MGPTPVFSEDDLIDQLQRAGQRDSLTGSAQRTIRQKLVLAGISALILGALVLATIWIRQPDPFTKSTLVPWHHPVVSNDGQDVTLSYEGGSCGTESVRTIVQETSSQVALTVVLVTQDPDDGACAGVGIARKAVAHLSKRLGTRKLVDGHCAQPASLKADRLRCSSHGFNARAWPPH